MANEMVLHCSDEALKPVLATLQDNDEMGLAGLARLLETHPFDSRLHFLKGSVLAGLQHYEEGRAAMQKAVEIAPEFAIARFQLGFLELTSGLAADATATWAHFAGLAEDQPFRILSEGLNCLARDEFPEAVRLLRRGMELNTEHPLINNDMQLLLDEIGDRAAPQPENKQVAESASATHMLLQQFELKDIANPKKR